MEPKHRTDFVGRRIRALKDTDWWNAGDIAVVTEALTIRIFEAEFENKKSWCVCRADFELVKENPFQLDLFEEEL